MINISDSLKDEASELFNTAVRIYNPINLKNLNSKVYREDFDKYLDAMITGGIYTLVALSSLVVVAQKYFGHN
ncbi:hypothetical protein HY212_03550 [Candidatus Pacearchaeota archaeon]|nr:hypothetical protein [Candidatus Pacearchaeota archaeon]